VEALTIPLWTHVRYGCVPGQGSRLGAWPIWLVVAVALGVAGILTLTAALGVGRGCLADHRRARRDRAAVLAEALARAGSIGHGPAEYERAWLPVVCHANVTLGLS
jgi:hypothetical protein